MSFNLSIPRSNGSSPVSLADVQRHIDQALTADNTEWTDIWSDDDIKAFNGRLWCAVSDGDYAMVIASGYKNDGNIAFHKFIETYGHNDCSTYTILLYPDGGWEVFDLVDDSCTPRPASEYEGLEGLEYLINKIRDRYLASNSPSLPAEGEVEEGEPTAIRLRACREVGTNVESCNRKQAHYYSVYEVRNGRDVWVADFSLDYAQNAIEYAAYLSNKQGCPFINDVGY